MMTRSVLLIYTYIVIIPSIRNFCMFEYLIIGYFRLRGAANAVSKIRGRYGAPYYKGA